MALTVASGAIIGYTYEMTVAEDILLLVRRKPGLTEAQIAKQLFGGEGYQQRVNSTCRRLVRDHRLERRGSGGPGDPYTYRYTRVMHRA